MPSEIMLQWNDGSSWEHRAYWGADMLGYGVENTASRHYAGPLPAAGQWVQLKVPTSQVGLEGSTVSGMGFSLYNGGATWDAAGLLSSTTTNTAAKVSVSVKSGLASRTSAQPGSVTFTRIGSTNADLTINYSLGGTAVSGIDYQLTPVNPISSSLIIPAGAASTTLEVVPLPSTNFVVARSLLFALDNAAAYVVGTPASATILVGGNTMPATLTLSTNGATLSWKSNSTKVYQVAYKNNLTDTVWTSAGQVTALGATSIWIDGTAKTAPQRFYLVAQVD